MVFQKRNPTCRLHQDADQSVKKTNPAPGRKPWASLSRDFSPGSHHTFTLGTAAEGSTNAGLRLILTNSKQILSQCCFKSLRQRDECSRTAETHTEHKRLLTHTRVVSQSMLPPTELKRKAQQPRVKANENDCWPAASHSRATRICQAALNPRTNTNLQYNNNFQDAVLFLFVL